MNGINQVTLVGYFAADPEIKFIPSGKAVLNFRLAVTTSSYNSTTKERKEFTEFVSCVTWFQAEWIAKTARKGTLASVQGQLRTRSWDAKDGTKRYSTEVACDQINLLARFGDKADESHQQTKHDKAKASGYVTEPQDDDIPF